VSAAGRVTLLKAILLARRRGDQPALAELEQRLDAIDHRGGYHRSKTSGEVLQPGQRTRNPGKYKQRNPRWREALDKLNAMRRGRQ
jgi:hypothetical protein